MLMHGMDATQYLPNVQIVFEYDCEFKLPGYQNRPNLFEMEIVDSTFIVIPDGSTPEITRSYSVVSYTLNDSGNNMRLERTDGVSGSLDYTQLAFWEAVHYGNSGSYFGGRNIIYNGPIPRKPAGWTPTQAISL